MATNLSIEETTNLVKQILENHNTSSQNAELVAKALVAAEVEGQKGHGLSRVASYSAQSKSGKVDGYATPEVLRVAESAIRVNAGQGFAYPAFKTAIDHLSDLSRKHGIAAAAITRSHHCGSLGYHAEMLAKKNIVALVFSNSPKAMAPWGGKEGVFGTNPIAFAAPRANSAPLVIDLSLSKVARGKVKVAHEKGEAIPEGWALDQDGNPTTNAEDAMSGTMIPMGDAKGFALVLMVEVLSAALTSSQFGFEAGSFFTAEGPSPSIGQFVIAIAPGPFSNNQFATRLETLISAILDQPGTRLPGSKKDAMREEARQNGLTINDNMMESLLALKGDS